MLALISCKLLLKRAHLLMFRSFELAQICWLLSEKFSKGAFSSRQWKHRVSVLPKLKLSRGYCRLSGSRCHNSQNRTGRVGGIICRNPYRNEVICICFVSYANSPVTYRALRLGGFVFRPMADR